MNHTQTMPVVQGLILFALESEAANNKPSRSNADYASDYGISLRKLDWHFYQLEKRRHIIIERAGLRRRFMVKKFNKLTKWHPEPNHTTPPMPELKETERPCMCCRKLFPSQGIHNRLCLSCGQLSPVQAITNGTRRVSI